MIPAGLVVGYHGCDRTLAEAVVLGREKLRPSRNAHDWLGHGIYFWQNDARRALEWAEELAGRHGSGVREPAAIGAVIDLGNCFNTAELKFSSLLERAFTAVQHSSIRLGSAMPVNSGQGWRNRRLDCAVFEAMHEIQRQRRQRSFDTVAGYFPEGGSVYPGAAVRRFDHVQICVRDEARIVGFFLPRPRLVR